MENKKDRELAAEKIGELRNSLEKLPTPCYVIDERKLRRNGEILKGVQERTGCKILLAQKAFSNYELYPLLSEYLAGTEASGLYEARLGAEEMPDRECHVFCAAYRQEEFDELLKWADHIVFNSPGQLKKYGLQAKRAGKSIGLRVNPECSTQEGHAIYDPCAPGSRLGTTRALWDARMGEEWIGLLDGLHFHTLCEQNADALECTLEAVEERFGEFLPRMKWLNMGGGHHITRKDYDVELLERCICRIKEKYDVQVYLEPGEAVALHAGYLVTQVLDLGPGGVAILDMSAACHAPDVLEMPYRPPLMGAGKPGEYAYTCRLGGPTCLAGDVIGEYSFPEELREGDRLIFEDMAIYTMCKNNTFNGMPLPDIYLLKEDGSTGLLAAFGYEDFKGRLGGKR
ncbi:MAG: carboxynorspermidine decarboxylase [Lachnospiraceae bacterium]|nr:carboxynorspermidine decarboxylase [Lachnospiraceae bacterium]